MKNTTKLLKILKSNIIVCCLIFITTATAQVGIGTTSPASGALLDLSDANRGLLVPRVSINVLGTAAPVTAPTTGLLVWNTFGGTGVGFHYWDGTQWVPIGGGATSNDWTIIGNAGVNGGNPTTPGTNFIGTTDAQNIDFRTNNIYRGRFSSLGEFFVGTTQTVLPGDLMNGVGNNTFPWALNGYSNGDGSGVYGSVTLDGALYSGGNTIYAGVQGEYMGTNALGPGVRGLTFTGTPGLNFVGGSISGVSGSLSGGSIDQTGTFLLNRAFGVMGTTGNNFATRVGGVIGTDLFASGALGYYASNNISYGVYAFGNPRANGVAGGRLMSGSQHPDTHVGLGINGGFLGGWIKGEKYGAMFAGDSFGSYTHGKTITNETFIVLDEKADGNKLATFASTSLSIDVQSKGIGQLSNGLSKIAFDKDFIDLIDGNKPIIVTVTPYGENNGIYLVSVDKTGFVIKENNNGNSNVKFNWIAIAEKTSNNRTVSEELLSKDFDKNTQLFMHNDTLEANAKAIWFENEVIHYGAKAPENNVRLENFKKLPNVSRPSADKKQ